MRRICLLTLLASVLLARIAGAQQPPAAAAPLTADQKAGRSIFQTRCAMCHVGQAPASEMATPAEQRRPATMGPLLSKASTANDAVVRQKIKDGSARMPGYKYTFNDAQVEQVIAFMKTVDTPLTRIFAARAGE